jgi:hypothetical protein
VKGDSACTLREKDSNDHSWNARNGNVVCSRNGFTFSILEKIGQERFEDRVIG